MKYFHFVLMYKKQCLVSSTYSDDAIMQRKHTKLINK